MLLVFQLKIYVEVFLNRLAVGGEHELNFDSVNYASPPIRS